MKLINKNKIVFFLFLIILSSSFSSFAFASPSLTLSPTSGHNGATVTTSGTGFSSSNNSKIYDNGHSNLISSWNGKVWARPFTSALSNNLPVGATITNMGLNVTSTGIGFNNQNSFHGEPNNISSLLGSVRATTCFCTSLSNNLPSGSTLTKVSLHIISEVASPAHVRIKIYNESSANHPGALIFETGSTAITCTACYQNFTVGGNVPISNPDIYVAMETDDNGLTVTGSSSDTGINISHSYGSGPNPFGASPSFTTPNVFFKVYSTSGTDIRVKIYKDDGAGTCTPNCPSTLLGESGSISVNNTGINKFPVSATVPASGNVWAAFEVDNSAFQIRGTTGSQSTTVTHTYGTGPSPFGTTSGTTNQPYALLYYNSAANVTLKYGSTILTTSPTPINPNSVGSFSGITFTVPVSIAGIHTINATDTNSLTALKNFTVTPQIFIAPTSGSVGDTVTVKGNGFTSSSNIVLRYDGSILTTSPGTVTTNSTGGFSGLTFTVPSSAFGSHTVNATDASNNSVITSFTVSSAHFTVSPNEGKVGSSVIVKGNGYGGSETITIKFDGATVTTFSANSTGGFSNSVTVPSAEAGSHTFSGTDTDFNFASASFLIDSSISISPTSGKVGSSIDIEGRGFTNTDSINIKFGGVLVTTSSTNSLGSFSEIFNAPNSIFGSHVVNASDTHSHFNSTTFSIIPNEILTPIKGSTGNSLFIAGKGFLSISTIHIYFNNTLMVTSPGTVTTNSTGSFNGISITIPVLPNGNYTVKSNDTSNNYDSETFTIQTSQPDAPTLTGLALSPTSARFISVAGASSGDDPVKDFGLRCSLNGGTVTSYVTNSTLPTTRFYEITGLQPSDSISCQWRDGSKAGWSDWSNNAVTKTSLGLVMPPMTNNHLTSFIKWIADHGGIYFGFTVGPFLPMLLGLMATPKTVGIFAVITLMAMGIVHASGLFIYPNWYWGLMLLFGVVLVLSRANEK